MKLVTTLSGLVHVEDCRLLRRSHMFFPWDPRNDGPGVARACAACLPGGLPT